MADLSVSVTVNGSAYTASIEPRKTLGDFLRDDCGLTGTHLGCEHGACGSCTVLLEDKAVRSCLLFAVQANGRQPLPLPDGTPLHYERHRPKQTTLYRLVQHTRPASSRTSRLAP